MLRPSLLILAAVALGTPPSYALELKLKGGGVGQTLTFDLTGPANEQYLNILSLTTGPTCFGPPHNICLDVGIEFLTLSISIPGFLGTFPGSGHVTLTYPIPPDPIFASLPPVNFQFIQFNANDTIVAKSNLCRLTLADPGTFEATLGVMAANRALVACRELDSGKILVSGGGDGSVFGGTGLNSCEIYDPCVEAFSPTGAMGAARAQHTITRLNDGRILVTGGVDATGIVLASAEVYNQASGTWSGVGAMARARVGHTASLLPDGRVLVAGGSSDATDALTLITSATKTTEIFNPATNTFAAGPDMTEPKLAHSATTLADGKVLVAGGMSFTLVFGIPVPNISAVAQVYDPASGSFGSKITMKAGRVAHSGTLLADGRVLLAGGAGGGNPLDPMALNSAELFNGASFASTGSLAAARAGHTATLLPDGRVLAAGGASGSITAPVSLSSAEVFNLASGTWSTTGAMTTTRSAQAALLLADLTVLIVGGAGGASESSLNTAEVYQP
ncbi:MAG: kelch repeat-containing protein [Planctomycetota bacterium]